MLLDLHSHILPECDDGAKNVPMSIELLKMMKNQGITDVIATPHFYPHDDTIDEFLLKVNKAYKKLSHLKTNDLPNILLGCELFYFKGISRSEHIFKFTLNDSKYILIEPNAYLLNKSFQNELLYLKNDLGLIPIIPHIERFYKAKGFKVFLKFIKENEILTQVNAASLLDKSYNKIIKKLMSQHIITFIATDTHSLNRPPLMSSALYEIEKRFSVNEKERILANLDTLLCEITKKENGNGIKYN